jgi:hypothetical protein
MCDRLALGCHRIAFSCQTNIEKAHLMDGTFILAFIIMPAVIVALGYAAVLWEEHRSD